MNRRRPLLAGNWKMHTNREAAKRLVQTLVDRVGQLSEVDVILCPPAPYLLMVHELLAGSRIELGAQNMHFETQGAYTGEISPTMLLDCGCRYVIIGHSERRHILGESDEFIQRKVRAALAADLRPILCVGETLEQREAGQTQDVVAAQLRSGLLGIVLEQLRLVTVAYEPVWAIGTGKVATPEQAEEVHSFIRDLITRMYGADLAQNIRIQYGGSVKADNAAGLMVKPNVDGALVGGASLNPDEFTGIVRAGIP